MTMNTPQRMLLLALGTTLALTAGCLHAVVVPRLGYIPDDIQLAPDPQNSASESFVSPAYQRSAYTRIVVEPVVMYPGAIMAISTDDARTLQRMLEASLVSALGSNAVMGPAPAGADTLVVHAAITEVKPSQPLLNIAPQSQMRGRGYGYASVEMVVRAGDNGPVLAAFMNTANTQRFDPEKLSRLGTAEEATRKWAADLAALLK